jgi:hypothetical protein
MSPNPRLPPWGPRDAQRGGSSFFHAGEDASECGGGSLTLRLGRVELVADYRGR